ncbi:hypothetical protein [Beduinella massiliensis]|uniref:hypothetical protein n=1 Tax=Beduinella massiliensis TaxID=1852363 RepID=UPI000C867855
MSTSPSAARPSAFAPVRAAFAAFRARPLALLPALGACVLAYVLRWVCNYFLPPLIPDTNLLLQQAVRYALAALSMLMDTAAALYVLRVFVRGERPGLSTLIEPLRWPAAYPKALFVQILFPVIFLALSVLLSVLCASFKESTQVVLILLFLPVLITVSLCWFEGSTVLLAVTRGKCRLRDFFMYPARSIASFFALFLCLDLPFLVVYSIPNLPEILAASTFEQLTFQVQSLVQSSAALTPSAVVPIILSPLRFLLFYTALGFLYERAVPASTSE